MSEHTGGFQVVRTYATRVAVTFDGRYCFVLTYI